MNDVTQVDYDALRNAANGFKTSSQVLKAVLVAIMGVIMVLRATAFVSRFSGVLADRFENQVKPAIEKLIATMDEMADDLLATIETYKGKDEQSSANFQN